MLAVGRPDRVPVDCRIVGYLHDAVASGAHSPDITLTALVRRPVGNAMAVGRPSRLRHVVCADEPFSERLNVDRPKTTRRNRAVTRISHSLFGVNNLLAVGRPGRMISRTSIG